MAKEKEEKPFDMRIAVAAVIAVVLLAAGYVYFGSNQAKAPEKKVAPLDSASAKLLLLSFDKEAQVADYYMNYTNSESGSKSTYELMQNGQNKWVRVTGTFGSMEGFFGKNNATDILCLRYGAAVKCAIVGNGTDPQDVANSLRILLLNPRASIEQRDQTEKLIAAGAIVFLGEPVNEQIGSFDTQKVSYTLDYRGLTVDKLMSLGISPNDPAIYSITELQTSRWVDKKTGVAVKSATTYKENLVPKSFDRVVTDFVAAPPKLPEVPANVVDIRAFLQFYQNSEKDFSERSTCANSPTAERDPCFKNLAVARHDWEICKLVKGIKDYERCTVIVAQDTNNKVLCEKLTLYSDDCYIAVVGNTGEAALCRNLKNPALAQNCTMAAAEGRKKVEAQEALVQKFIAGMNCKLDSDCRIAGNANQYCAAKNDTATYAVETSPLFACLKNVPCGCNEGYCGFKKNDTYYQCIAGVEDRELEAFIQNKTASVNTTKPG